MTKELRGRETLQQTARREQQNHCPLQNQFAQDPQKDARPVNYRLRVLCGERVYIVKKGLKMENRKHS